MAKQSIFGRIAQLAKANINALLDAAEDPAKMLDQMVRDYSNSIAEAESRSPQTIGNLRLLEQDHAEDVANAEDWGRKAIAASRKGDELRSAGNSVDADKFDNLAKVALGRQMAAEKEARDAEPTIANADRRRRPAQAWPRRHARQARRAVVEARPAHRPREDGADADPGHGCHEEHRPARPDERDQPVRGEGAPRGVPRARRAGARGIEPRRPVRAARDASDESIELDARLAALKSGSSPKAVTSGE
jgi:phage shock protein A